MINLYLEMIFLKKVIALLLILVMIFTLCACGKSTEVADAAEDENKVEESQTETVQDTGPDADENAKYLKGLNIQKIDDYLYTAYVEDYDYDYALERFAYLFKADGGCAAIRNGDLRGRNYDWTYDDQAYFVISTPAKDGRHAVLGVSGSISSLTGDVVDSKQWSDGYKSLAFATLDGVNDAGVVCNILVVPSGEAGITSGSNPGAEDLPAAMVNRYVLDYASSVDEAVELLKNRNVYMPHTEVMDQEFHWMISDREKTVMVEFVDNEMVVLEDEKIATNFYLYNFDKTGKTIQNVPEGIERYNIIADGYDTTSTIEGMMEMLKSIRYSKCYSLDTVPFWYSEYSDSEYTSALFGQSDLSDGDLSKAGAFEGKITDALDNWSKGRNNDTWITVYSAVYDMKNLTLSVLNQERDTQYDFSLE